MNLTGKFLMEIFKVVGKEDICVLHGYENFPESISSDVDVVISPKGLRILLEYNFSDWKIVQCLRHEASSYYLVFASVGLALPEYLALDIAFDCRRDGCVFYTGAEILAQCELSARSIPIPSPRIEFGYYVTKKIGKTSINAAQAARLSELWAKDPEGCRIELHRFLPAGMRGLIEIAANSGNWQAVWATDAATLRNGMRAHMLFTHPQAFLAYYVSEVSRIIKRILHPTGYVISFMGPDGAGKSTLIEKVEHRLDLVFRGTRKFHLRPYWGSHQRAGPPINSPHAREPRNTAQSVLKIALWFLDYTLGYIVAVSPLKIRSTLVLFDRYFLDIIIDPARYRYGGPAWLAQVVGRIAFHPDLFFVLDAPIEILRSRKIEVSYEESVRQHVAYCKFAEQTKNAVLVDVSKSVEEAVSTVENAILSHLSVRARYLLKGNLPYERAYSGVTFSRLKM
jgi:thymidylate kinase